MPFPSWYPSSMGFPGKVPICRFLHHTRAGDHQSFRFLLQWIHQSMIHNQQRNGQSFGTLIQWPVACEKSSFLANFGHLQYQQNMVMDHGWIMIYDHNPIIITDAPWMFLGPSHISAMFLCKSSNLCNLIMDQMD